MAEIHEEISVELPSVEEQSRSRERMAREELGMDLLHFWLRNLLIIYKHLISFPA